VAHRNHGNHAKEYALRKETGLFASFCGRAKGRRQAGRDPPVLLLFLKKDKEQQIIDLLLKTTKNHRNTQTVGGQKQTPHYLSVRFVNNLSGGYNVSRSLCSSWCNLCYHLSLLQKSSSPENGDTVF
jgi:hypothetical protein